MSKFRVIKVLIGIPLVVSFFILFSFSIASASQWAKTYSGTDYVFANSIQQTSDGGYIVAGDAYSLGGSYYLSDAWVLKLDNNGNVVWQKTYGGTADDSANSVQQTSDGGYIVAGRTYSFGAGVGDPWVLKLDNNGNVVWQKTYGGTAGDSANSVQQTSDGGYIVAGDTFGADTDIDAWVLKLDGNGNVVWQKTYGGVDEERAYSVQQTSDGGYIVAGRTYSFGVRYYDAWVLKLDANGNVVWQKTYGGVDDDNAYSVQEASDGGYIVVGYTRSFGSYNCNAWVLKLDGNGNVVWQKTFGTKIVNSAHSVQQTTDGGYIVTGNFAADTDVDAWVLKLDGNGNVVWQKTYGGINDDIAHSVQQTSDGGYIVAGYTDSFGAGYADAWVLKLDANGDINNCSIVKPSELAHDSYATVQDTNVIGADSYISPQPSTASVADVNAIVTEVCYSEVTLITPDGGEIIPSGSTYTTRWGAPLEAVKFKLQYSINNGSTWKLIASNVIGTSYNWGVPIPKNNKVNCLIKVIGYNDSGTKVGEDTSDSTFAIEVVKLTDPDGGEALTPGSTYTITWTTNATKNPVTSTKLFYTTNGGSTWKRIITLTGNPGSSNWTVPNVTSGTCKVKVVLKDASGVNVGSDVSDGVFNIIQP